MDTTFEAFLTSWDFRLDIIIPQGTLIALYIIGWARLRQKGAKLATRWRLASYMAGMAFLSIALMSGIDIFQPLLFFMHMIQHELLMMIAPPLIFFGAPMPIAFWGLPRNWRRKVGRIFTKKSQVRRILREASSPGFIWLLFTITLILWHDPVAYDTATNNQLIHDIEHIMFFGTAVLMWWHITGAAPKIHKSRTYPARLAVIALAFFVNLMVGVTITMWGEVIYKHYESVPRVWGLSPADDQMIGGLIMWIPGGMMYLLAIIVLIGLWIREQELQTRVDQRQINTSKILSR